MRSSRAVAHAATAALRTLWRAPGRAAAGERRDLAAVPAGLGAMLAGVALLVLVSCGGGSFQETPPPAPAEFGRSQSGQRESGAAQRLRDAARATYRVYVANESSDDVSRVAFTPGEGAVVEKTIPVGIMPGDIDGPHGITVSADGTRWYVSIAHGTPNGYVWQFATGSDSLVARTELGRFPSTMGITPDGSMLFVVNFNLHGDPVPSEVSVVYTPSMTALSHIPTCVRPHGSSVNASGTTHYSGCAGSEQVVAIDIQTLEVSTRFSVVPGGEGVLPLTDLGAGTSGGGSGPPGQGASGADGGRDGSGGAAGAGGGTPPDTSGIDRIVVAPSLQRTCSPTWVEPARGTRADRVVYVTCNRNAEVLEVATDSWAVLDRFPAGPSPYNLEATRDGRYLLATLRTEEGGVAVIDLDAGGEVVARLETTESLTHGVVASPDGRYAFVTNEAVGSTRGTLDVFDLRSLERVASVELGHQSGGIDFWEIERLGR